MASEQESPAATAAEPSGSQPPTLPKINLSVGTASERLRRRFGLPRGTRIGVILSRAVEYVESTIPPSEVEQQEDREAEEARKAKK